MKKSFEEKLARLEEIDRQLVDTEEPLSRTMELFEEGIKLSKELEQELARIERKVEILINEPEKPEEKPELELFETDS